MEAILILLNCLFFIGAKGQLYDGLYLYLTTGGPSLTIPMTERDKPVVVTFNLMLTNVLEINTQQMYIDALAWHMLSWTDTRLDWDSDYNLNEIAFPQDMLWKPDIMLMNSHEMKKTTDVQAVIYRGGHVTVIDPIRFRTTCHEADDDPAVVECNMKFGSWVYNDHSLDLQPQHDNNMADLSSYELNPKWELLNSTFVRTVSTYPCCAEGYVDITYSFRFRGQ